MKAFELLDNPSKLIKDAYAKDARGYHCNINENSATCWCVIGAISKCYTDRKEYINAIYKLEKYINSLTAWAGISQIEWKPENRSIVGWNYANDYTTVVNTLKELDI